jgi:hypothetical protein
MVYRKYLSDERSLPSVCVEARKHSIAMMHAPHQLVRLGLISTNCSSSSSSLLPFLPTSTVSSSSSSGRLSFASVVLGLRPNLLSSGLLPPSSSSSSEESSSLLNVPPNRPLSWRKCKPASRSSVSVAGARDSSSVGSSGSE